MNTGDIICAAIAGVASIVCAVIALYTAKQQAKNAKREERRAEESLLLLEMMDTTLQLNEATANAVLGKTNNGNVERAYNKLTEVKDKYKAFQLKIMSEGML